ncbi:hypothetical protein VKA52_02710 [Halobacillus sp. HZG1]|uniref:hypothetical protein n=1 Tax=Halobacillus sp. HZG1 TaxID=3111769 RepID=UPI002DB83C70|nr:hypothetical protein [Halobacillus sp. HZG1]MEC3882636.1 hypothetical protein [Halobacillus sp. HZG1]
MEINQGIFNAIELSPAEAGDAKGIRLLKDNLTVLELVISESALADQRSGIDSDNLYPWLYDTAVLIAEHREGKEPKRYILTSYDVNSGNLNTTIDQIKQKDI